jgi:hypothetical protein
VERREEITATFGSMGVKNRFYRNRKRESLIKARHGRGVTAG